MPTTNDPSKYGKLRDPQQGDDKKVEVSVPRMITLPLQAAQLYQNLLGAVMPHELLAEIEQHLASPDITLGNGDDWGLVKNGDGWRTGYSKTQVTYRVDNKRHHHKR